MIEGSYMDQCQTKGAGSISTRRIYLMSLTKQFDHVHVDIKKIIKELSMRAICSVSKPFKYHGKNQSSYITCVLIEYCGTSFFCKQVGVKKLMLKIYDRTIESLTWSR